MKTKHFGMVLLFCGLLLGLCGSFTLIFGAYEAMQWEPGPDKQVPCYDRFQNEIEGVDCKEKDNNDTLGFALFASMFLLGASFGICKCSIELIKNPRYY